MQLMEVEASITLRDLRETPAARRQSARKDALWLSVRDLLGPPVLSVSNIHWIRGL